MQLCYCFVLDSAQQNARLINNKIIAFDIYIEVELIMNIILIFEFFPNQLTASSIIGTSRHHTTLLNISRSRNIYLINDNTFQQTEKQQQKKTENHQSNNEFRYCCCWTFFFFLILRLFDVYAVFAPNSISIQFQFLAHMCKCKTLTHATLMILMEKYIKSILWLCVNECCFRFVWYFFFGVRKNKIKKK